MSKPDNKTIKPTDTRLPQINEERIEKSLTTSYLDNKLSGAGAPKPGSGGSGGKDKSSG
jgi:hypothetical protein